MIKKNFIRLKTTCLLSTACNEVFAHAGPVDRYIDMMRAQTTIAYVVTLIVVAILAFRKFCLTSTLNKCVIRTALVSYSVSWIMVGLGLFNSWPFFLATLFAPIYIYPVVKYLNVYKKTNPRKRLYRILINIGFTLIGTILFWTFMSAYAGMCEFLCAYLIPDVLFYRDIRDCIYNLTTFDMNYISGIFVVHAIWMFIKLLMQYNKEKTT